MPVSSEARAGRIAGLDSLRTLSMLMVIVLHILGHGGVLASAPARSGAWYTAWLLESLCYCAVNCYALISGYVGSLRRGGFAALAELWLQVVFFSVLYAAVFRAVNYEWSGRKELFAALLPVSRRQYWYFSAYFGLSLLSPLLSGLPERLSRRRCALCAGAMLVAFCLLPMLFAADPYHMRGGYALIWLLLMYLFGALMRRGDFAALFKRPAAFLALALFFSALTFLSAVLPHAKSLNLLSYTSATVLLSAVCLVLFFARMSSCKSPVSRAFAALGPRSFGVYILHTNALLWSFAVPAGSLAGLSAFSPPLMAAAVAALAAAVYLAASGIDAARAALFRLLRVRPLLEKLERAVLGEK
ncbi:MAG: acyltransferase [Oscillospiraceae bacterium]|nr:acyltransferase [Oscillospiraceae bacterium]